MHQCTFPAVALKLCFVAIVVLLIVPYSYCKKSHCYGWFWFKFKLPQEVTLTNIARVCRAYVVYLRQTTKL